MERIAAVALVLVALQACDGCLERLQHSGMDGGLSQAEQGSGGMQGRARPAPVKEVPTQARLMELAGRVDTTNRYPSGVLVTVEFGQDRRGVCSGAVISRWLVLTAGHCVCRSRSVTSEPGSPREIIDNSACAKTATVQTMLYESAVLMVDTEVPVLRDYLEGEVRPHPELRVLLDEGQVASSHADLAVIILKKPLGTRFRPLPLADSEVELNETLVITGSGYDELSRRYDGERRYSRNRVTEILSSREGRMRIEQPGGHHYKGDSGGPCLREGPGGVVLAGVSSRNLGEGEAITSIYEYRDWLLDEIQHAEENKRPTPVQ
ncbi:MAG TPA: trypsin-like serine protease [Hyalangium sp.]|nr:trypsin-like serine protease [Hyalangium sp.]